MKNHKTFSNVKKVAVIGGTIDSTETLQAEIRICSVIQVGEADIMVTEDGVNYGSKPIIVPKSLCIPIHTSSDKLLTSKKCTPELGDLVFYCGKLDWKDKTEAQLAGILCEIHYRTGIPIRGSLLIEGEMKAVEFDHLMVLQKKA
jgi:hypothetical protein